MRSLLCVNDVARSLGQSVTARREPAPPPFHNRSLPVHALPEAVVRVGGLGGEYLRASSPSRGDALGAADAAVDVGPDSIKLLAELVTGAGAVLVHGPLGVCELAYGVAARLAHLTLESGVQQPNRLPLRALPLQCL